MTDNNNHPFKALVFDLDGTLIDSVLDVCASMNRVLTAHGRRQLSVAEAKDKIGWGGRVLVEKALAATGEAGSEDEIEECLEGFLATYADQPADHTTVFPGVIKALEEFCNVGIKMGICTNKPMATTLPVMTAMGLDGFFDVISCGDSVLHKKPDGRHVLGVIDKLGATVETAAMIGDSESDITAAINAGVKSVAVTFGYAHIPHAEMGADFLIDHFDHLPRALVEISKGEAAS